MTVSSRSRWLHDARYLTTLLSSDLFMTILIAYMAIFQNLRQCMHCFSIISIGYLCVCDWLDMLNFQYMPPIWLFSGERFFIGFLIVAIHSIICVFVRKPVHQHHTEIKSGFIDYSCRHFRHVFFCALMVFMMPCQQQTHESQSVQCRNAMSMHKRFSENSNICDDYWNY